MEAAIYALVFAASLALLLTARLLVRIIGHAGQAAIRFLWWITGSTPQR